MIPLSFASPCPFSGSNKLWTDWQPEHGIRHGTAARIRPFPECPWAAGVHSSTPANRPNWPTPLRTSSPRTTSNCLKNANICFFVQKFPSWIKQLPVVYLINLFELIYPKIFLTSFPIIYFVYSLVPHQT
jgi:hypothetical protein